MVVHHDESPKTTLLVSSCTRPTCSRSSLTTFVHGLAHVLKRFPFGISHRSVKLQRHCILLQSRFLYCQSRRTASRLPTCRPNSLGTLITGLRLQLKSCVGTRL